MLHRVALVRTSVSEELSASIIKMTRIGELWTLAVTGVRRLLLTANVVPNSPILATLMMEALGSSEMSILQKEIYLRASLFSLLLLLTRSVISFIIISIYVNSYSNYYYIRELLFRSLFLLLFLLLLFAWAIILLIIIYSIPHMMKWWASIRPKERWKEAADAWFQALT
jgi:hypothetical protein